MKFAKFARVLAPVAAMALATALSACDGAHFSINGEDGKKLSELDMSGTAPTELVLAGPDAVNVTQGDKLAITVDGDEELAKQMRFTLKDGALGIMRKDGKWGGDDGRVTVNVTMPALRELTLAGSGKITAAALTKDAQITIAGSGEVDTPTVAADSLKIDVAGSGSYRAGGTVRELKLTVAGSGNAEMPTLKVDSAKLTIAGSGSARFASDGNVSADIMGSGSIYVTGRATCKVSSMGSGKLVCEPAAEAPAPAADANTAAPKT
ncbi:MAG TPA: head GIN domain-containing protein [Novosphingobium sp.]|nr:head GIN domain-containing protein [Novosphingobium sp.]